MLKTGIDIFGIFFFKFYKYYFTNLRNLKWGEVQEKCTLKMPSMHTIDIYLYQLQIYIEWPKIIYITIGSYLIISYTHIDNSKRISLYSYTYNNTFCNIHIHSLKGTLKSKLKTESKYIWGIVCVFYLYRRKDAIAISEP